MVGCVSGHLMLASQDGEISQGHNFYWRYELWLRQMESRLNLLHTGSGVALAFRKNLFQLLAPDHGDDCAIPLDVLRQGYRVVHDSEALVFDAFPHTVSGEFRARIRMTLRNFSCTLAKLPPFLNLFNFPFLGPAILFHRLLRWLTPYFLLALLLANSLLLGLRPIFNLTFALQIIFYILGLAGFIAFKKDRRIPLASQAFAFLLANIGFFLGVLKVIQGKKITSYGN
jgi:cellulose synthase/poly-beta-1,6-N-acetylglucosamine synthase-like glycosyltransferase